MICSSLNCTFFMLVLRLFMVTEDSHVDCTGSRRAGQFITPTRDYDAKENRSRSAKAQMKRPNNLAIYA
jgi:hypothetical protein